MSNTPVAKKLSTQELENALEVFGRVSRELDTSYRELEGRIRGLSEELSTARNARIKELAEKERLAHRLSSLVSALPGGVVILNAEQRVVDGNPAALEILGEPLFGELWAEVLARQAEGKADVTAKEMQLRNGKRISLTSRQLDPAGDAIVLITDITDIHGLQAQLSRKRRLTSLGEMSARLAHQIRTPLSSTVLYLSQLSRADISEQKRKELAGKIGERLTHMGQQVDGMLSFVRGGPANRELVYLNSILGEFVANMAPQLEATGSTMKVIEVDDSLVLDANRGALVDALSNIAMNAIDVAGGEVDIYVWVGALNADKVQIVIRDNGPGIDDALMERIFDPFFTTRAAGTGLGLAVVEMSINDHGGEVFARNNPQGGAEFVITLPISHASAVQMAV